MSRVVLFGGRLGCACFVLQFHALSCANFRRSSHRYQNKKTSHVCDQFTVAGSVFGLNLVSKSSCEKYNADCDKQIFKVDSMMPSETSLF